jgi:uncharacterized protein YbjT (DUF2867 family)
LPEYYDVKKDVQEAVMKANIEYTFIATGVFTEFFYSPFHGFDFFNHKAAVFGPPNMKISTGFSDDFVKMVPEVLIHPASKNARVNLARLVGLLVGNHSYYFSFTLTLEEAIQTFEEVTGKKFERVHESEEELRKAYQELAGQGLKRVGPFIKLVAIRGDAEFKEPFNEVHPEFKSIKTHTFKEAAEKIVQFWKDRLDLLANAK